MEQLIILGGRLHRGPLSQALCAMNETEMIMQGVASIRAVEKACKEDCGRILREPCPFNAHSRCLRIKAAARHAVKAYDTRN